MIRKIVSGICDKKKHYFIRMDYSADFKWISNDFKEKQILYSFFF